MTTTRVLAEVGERIPEDGPAAHHRLLKERGAADSVRAIEDVVRAVRTGMELAPT